MSAKFSTNLWSDAFEDMVRFEVKDGRLRLGDLESVGVVDACNGRWLAWGHRSGDRIDAVMAMTEDLYRSISFIIDSTPDDTVVCHNAEEYIDTTETLARLSNEAEFLNNAFGSRERSLKTPTGVFFLGSDEPSDDAVSKAVDDGGPTYGNAGNGLCAGLFGDKCSIVELHNLLVDAVEMVEVKAR